MIHQIDFVLDFETGWVEKTQKNLNQVSLLLIQKNLEVLRVQGKTIRGYWSVYQQTSVLIVHFRQALSYHQVNSIVSCLMPTAQEQEHLRRVYCYYLNSVFDYAYLYQVLRTNYQHLKEIFIIQFIQAQLLIAVLNSFTFF